MHLGNLFLYVWYNSRSSNVGGSLLLLRSNNAFSNPAVSNRQLYKEQSAPESVDIFNYTFEMIWHPHNRESANTQLTIPLSRIFSAACQSLPINLFSASQVCLQLTNSRCLHEWAQPRGPGGFNLRGWGGRYCQEVFLAYQRSRDVS